jgi:hypothetical protein
MAVFNGAIVSAAWCMSTALRCDDFLHPIGSHPREPVLVPLAGALSRALSHADRGVRRHRPVAMGSDGEASLIEAALTCSFERQGSRCGIRHGQVAMRPIIGPSLAVFNFLGRWPSVR